jgi:hypothetical protein
LKWSWIKKIKFYIWKSICWRSLEFPQLFKKWPKSSASHLWC